MEKNVYIYDWRYCFVEALSMHKIIGFAIDESQKFIVSDFKPYFYVLVGSNDQIEKVKNKCFECGLNEFEFVEKTLLRERTTKLFMKIKYTNPLHKKEFILNNTFEMFEEDLSPEETFYSLFDHAIGAFRIIGTLHASETKEFISCKIHDICSLKEVTIDKHPLVLCVDIEVYSSNHQKMPSPDLCRDSIFMISALCQKYKQPNTAQKFILHCCPVDINFEEKVKVRRFSSEINMIIGYFDLVKEVDPDVITGYNIFGFDFYYMHYRMGRLLVPVPNVSRITRHTKIKNINWKSSAYGYNNYVFFEAIGRCSIDVYQYINREYRLQSYKLADVSRYFLQEDKVDLSPQEMFNLYLIGHTRAEHLAVEAITKIAAYCLQDSVLAMKLFDEMNVWTGLTELSSITNVRVEELYTRGQQTRVKARLHRACVLSNVVMDRSKEKGQDYEGAYVVDPIPGMYEWCFSLDFSSLYPSIIVAYNICYSTFMGVSFCSERLPIGDDEVHTISIDDKVYKFLKEPKGIVPTILTSFIDERKLTKDKLSKAQGIQKIVLDKRQYALKISANSVYGSFGVKEAGYLTFTEGASCTTAMGREVIKRAKDLLTKKGMNVVYGDTDSCITQNLALKDMTIQERDFFCASIASDLSSYFPSPLKLEFENVFSSFIIFSKKKYAAKMERGQSELDKYMFKGVVSARRDGCAFMRTTYSDVLKMILDGKNQKEIYPYLRNKLLDLYLLNVPLNDLVVKRGYNGWYKLSSNPQNIFANKLKERGDDVSPGQKLEFVFVKSVDLHPERRILQGEKMEAPHKVSISDIDVDYYIEKQLKKPIDQLLELCKMDPYVEAFQTFVSDI